MRILVHGINYHPETVGIGQYTTDLCEDLASRGHEVTVVTAVPYYPWWRVVSAYRGRLLVDEERAGVQVLRNWLYVPRRVTTPGRIVHELSFTALSAFRVLARRQFDLLVTVSPPLFLGAVARAYGGLYGVPYVFLVQDLQPDSAADLGMLDRSLLMRAALPFLYALERWIYRGAARTTVLTRGMARMVRAKGIDPYSVVVAPNWVDGGRLRPVDGSAFRERHGLGHRFVVLHAGNMGVKQGLENVLDAADRLRGEEEILFLLVGEGACREALLEEARARDLPNVRFLLLQPSEEVAAMHSAADVCLMSHRPEVLDIAMPCKVMGILACGRPLLATTHPDTQVGRVVEEGGVGLVVPPGDPDALAGAVLEAREDPERRRRWGRAARSYALEHWEKQRVLDAFERVLCEAAEARG